MDYIKKLHYKMFIKHPESVNQTYIEHFNHTISYSIILAKFSLYECIHAIIPGIDIYKFVGTTSYKEINELYKDIKKDRLREK